jgi:hypothetical protein
MLTRSQTSWLASILALSGAASLAACSSGSGHDGTSTASTGPSSAPQLNGVQPDFARPAWATPENFVGRAAAEERITIQVHLRMRNEAAADAELAAISDPDNASYGQFLSNEEFEAKYAPAAEDIAAVRAHLESSGLSVTYVPDNRAFVTAQGTVQATERAFATRLGMYKVGEVAKRAPMDTPAAPAQLQGAVLGVLGLSTVEMSPRYTAKSQAGVRKGGIRRDSLLPKAAPGAQVCSEWFGQQLDTVDPPYGPGL